MSSIEHNEKWSVSLGRAKNQSVQSENAQPGEPFADVRGGGIFKEHPHSIYRSELLRSQRALTRRSVKESSKIAWDRLFDSLCFLCPLLRFPFSTNWRSITLALCNCDFELPIEHPKMSAISLCS